MQAVKQSEHLISSEDERDYFNMVVEKLGNQLEELHDIKEKVALYQQMARENEELQEQDRSEPTLERQETEVMEE